MHRSRRLGQAFHRGPVGSSIDLQNPCGGWIERYAITALGAEVAGRPDPDGDLAVPGFIGEAELPNGAPWNGLPCGGKQLFDWLRLPDLALGFFPGEFHGFRRLVRRHPEHALDRSEEHTSELQSLRHL